MSDKLILLVENNADDEILALRAFKKLGLPGHIMVARHGLEALDFLFGSGQYADRNITQTPDMVLLDLKLPKLSGIEVLRRIRGHEFTRLLPVIIFSSSVEPQDVSQSYQLGANSYIRKPADLEQLDEIINLLARYWLFHNEPPPQL